MNDNKKITKLKPAEALRTWCTQQCLCMKQFNIEAIVDCQGTSTGCPFYPYRLGKRPPIKVFRLFCGNCMGGCRESVTDCRTIDCQIYPYRLGTNPSRQGIGGIGNMHKSRQHGREWADNEQTPVLLGEGMQRDGGETQNHLAVKYAASRKVGGSNKLHRGKIVHLPEAMCNHRTWPIIQSEIFL